METPEFLVWAVEYQCPIRGFQDGSDPEKTERQLRAARAVSDARREGRILDGLCVSPPNAFRFDDALAIYGGLSTIEQCCGACPANSKANSLAGCFGLVPVSKGLREAITIAFESAADTNAGHLFPTTRPHWYGLWLQSPCTRGQLAFLCDLVASPPMAGLNRPALANLQAGLRSALAHNLHFHAALFPPGRVDGPWWRLSPHCPRCKALWPAADARHCKTCDYAGHPAPDKKRHARGLRPYVPLTQLLGERQAAEFLVRYETFRLQQELQAQAETPPHSAQPGNPPAD